ncbi:acyl-CoA dehydrogenase family protein [Conexibacter sp. SYSU D00693]|uniref:acyl-CoA dehydrogenase family protein n=1 Tax=Conexibacter sp. SYSU D00693 TaxID=2812560 RepID=UPI00196B03F6|nr:acyl-CoA dehydrogenase family protein [Conexibacter sp. SYSU D00693]
MDFDLTDDQREIQRTARDLLAGRATPEAVRRHAEARSYDDGLWRELCELGWPGIAVAEEHGGQGLGLVELCVLAEELGRVTAPVPFLGSVTAALLIQAGGSEDLKRRWLPGLASGELRGAAGRPGALVPDADGADVLVLVDRGGVRVLAKEDCDVRPVDAIDPTRRHAVLATRPPRGHRIGIGGVFAGQVVVAAELVGVADRALAMTLDYVKDRKQFGTPVGAFQAVQHKVAQMLLDTERARTTTAFAAWAADAGDERLPEAAAMAASSAADGALAVCDSAVQAHGGIGFTWEADVHWLLKRAHLDSALLEGGKAHRAALARLLTRRQTAVAA